jgi:hypothetical protein
MKTLAALAALALTLAAVGASRHDHTAACIDAGHAPAHCSAWQDAR